MLPAPHPARAGLSLIDLSLALTVLAVGVGAVLNTLVATRSLSRSEHERAKAVDAAASVLETMKTTAFDEVFARFNADPDDDPDGPGTASGSGFAVTGLRARDGDADGLCGIVEFPGGAFELREDVADDDFGTPRDLDGDGAVDAADHAADYTLLPVRVRVEWRGDRGVEEVTLVSALTDLG